MPSYIDHLLRMLHNPYANPDPLDEAFARWNELSAAKRDVLIAQASTMEWVLQMVDTYGRLLPGYGERALCELGKTSRATLQNYIATCSAHRANHPDVPLAYALVNLAGRPAHMVLEPVEQLLAIGAYMYMDWRVLIDDGVTKRHRTKLQVAHIYSLLTHIFPGVAAKIKVDGLQRFLQDVVQDDLATFTLAWEGEKKVWEEFLLKLPNTCQGPNERWQSDARVLPMYGISANGIVCTFTLVSVMDE